MDKARWIIDVRGGIGQRDDGADIFRHGEQGRRHTVLARARLSGAPSDAVLLALLPQSGAGGEHRDRNSWPAAADLLASNSSTRASKAATVTAPSLRPKAALEGSAALIVDRHLASPAAASDDLFSR